MTEEGENLRRFPGTLAVDVVKWEGSVDGPIRGCIVLEKAESGGLGERQDDQSILSATKGKQRQRTIRAGSSR